MERLPPSAQELAMIPQPRLRRVSFVWLPAIAALLGSYVAPQTCLAQNKGGQNQAIGANLVTNVSGKLVSFKRGALIVTGDDGKEYTVALPDQPTAFTFVAQAKPPFLQRGMLVRFQGTFNQAGQAQGEVKRVILFQPPTGKLKGHQREQYVPGIYPIKKLEAGQPPPQVAEVRVVGGIMGLDDAGVMSVMVGRQTIQVPVASDAKFEIRFHNMSLVQEGDPIKVEGFYQEGAETQVKASRVTILPTRVYGEPGDGSEDGGKPNRKRGKRDRKNAGDASLQTKP